MRPAGDDTRPGGPSPGGIGNGAMDRNVFFLVISGIAFATAVMTPAPLLTFRWLPAVLPEIFLVSLQLMIFINTLLFAMVVIAVSGVPAALFERIAGRPRGDDVTMIVWTISAAGVATTLTWVSGGFG